MGGSGLALECQPLVIDESQSVAELFPLPGGGPICSSADLTSSCIPMPATRWAKKPAMPTHTICGPSWASLDAPRASLPLFLHLTQFFFCHFAREIITIKKRELRQVGRRQTSGGRAAAAIFIFNIRAVSFHSNGIFSRECFVAVINKHHQLKGAITKEM